MTITKGMVAPENYRMTGREFKERRERLGMTQGELAGRLGVNEDSIGKWERGVRPMLNPWMVNLALTCLEMAHAEMKGWVEATIDFHQKKRDYKLWNPSS